ncbi:hypothetical protein SASPL_140315 [Salvia splendens]|uniref:NB-ARC domain-containing protein n=1 Tax=Salvia splendens TaxID=180675 RepID=A0A8X8WRR2_SALSN|nr:hypothetical protein SASPL_140315 [Salvia splendens]
MLTQTHPQEEEEEPTFIIHVLLGMGGMGKTALAREVFNDERKIISTLTPSYTGHGVQNRESILKKLQEALKDQNYLLVLDGVWSGDVQEWEGFMNSMSVVTSTIGNGITITTMSQKVASTVKPFHIHKLHGLSDDWSIIKAKGFDGNGEVPPEFERIGSVESWDLGRLEQLMLDVSV